jgi:hypothetical protein
MKRPSPLRWGASEGALPVCKGLLAWWLIKVVDWVGRSYRKTLFSGLLLSWPGTRLEASLV